MGLLVTKVMHWRECGLNILCFLLCCYSDSYQTAASLSGIFHSFTSSVSLRRANILVSLSPCSDGHSSLISADR